MESKSSARDGLPPPPQIPALLHSLTVSKSAVMLQNGSTHTQEAEEEDQDWYCPVNLSQELSSEHHKQTHCFG